MTNKKALEWVLAREDVPADIREKLEKMVIQLDKKNAHNGERNEKAVEAKTALANAIYSFMEEDKQYTCTDILKGCEACKELSNPKVTSTLYYMIDCNMIVNKKEKGKSYFARVTA